MLVKPLVRPICRAIAGRPTASLGAGFNAATLLTAMSDSTKPMPAFVEGWALNSFNGVSSSAPTVAGISTDAQSQLQLEYTVSGASGSTTLTISAGDQSKGTGVWGGVIQHDNGTYGLYTIHTLGSGVATCFPPLRAAVTSKTMRNLGGTVNGQHYTLPGYKALARNIYSRTKGDCYRLRYAAKWTARLGVKEDWTNIGGLGTGQYSLATDNSFVGNGNLLSTWISRATNYIRALPTSPYTGKGLSKTFSLGGASGFLEAFISCSLGAPGATLPFASFRVEVIADGSTIHDQTYDSNAGLLRLVVPYSGVTSATLRVTRAGEEAAAYGIRIGDVTWWAYDRSETWTDKIIGKNEKVAVIGDSWTEFYSDGLGAELQQAMTDDGGSGSVVSVGLSGQTAEWGLANFDALVASENPNVVVILFFTNDRNSFGDTEAGIERWLKAMYQIGLKCQAIGARPVFVMPLPTASQSQASGHGKWAERIGAGLPIQ